jgi:hypothetical protein
MTGRFHSIQNTLKCCYLQVNCLKSLNKMDISKHCFKQLDKTKLASKVVQELYIYTNQITGKRNV